MVSTLLVFLIVTSMGKHVGAAGIELLLLLSFNPLLVYPTPPTDVVLFHYQYPFNVTGQ